MSTVTLDRPEVAATERGFTWRCRKHQGTVTCAATGIDPAEYVKHMRDHSCRPPTLDFRPIRLKRKPPAATLPKLPVDPMAEVTWSEDHLNPVTCECGHPERTHGPDWVTDTEGYWDTSGRRGRRTWHPAESHMTDPGCTEDGCGCTVADYEIPRDVTTAERRGQVWGAGSRPGTVWVIPFEPAPWEDGTPAMVQLSTRDGLSLSRRITAGEQRRLIRLADKIARDGVYGVRDPNGSFAYAKYTYHVDPGCPDGSPDHDREGGHVARRVIAVLLDEYGTQRDANMQLCGHCIPQYASEAAEDGPAEAQATPEATTDTGAEVAPEAEQETAEREQPQETERPVIAHMIERGVREAARSASRPPAQDWAAKSADLKERLEQRRQARANAHHAAVALREMAETEPASQPGTVTRQAREPIDGALLLDYVRLYLERFAVWPSDAALDAAVLWIAHSHARSEKGRLVFQYTPRWLLLSSDPGSGKSWMLRIMLKLAAQGKLLIEPTPAAVARSVGLQQRTVGLDEGDVLWGAGGRNAQIRAIVNTGYEPDGEWSRATKGNDTSDIPVFGPMAMAGLDKIKTATGDTLRAMLDRCIIVRVRKAPDGYRPPRFDDKARMIAAALSNAQAAWCAQEIATLAAAVPEVPEGLGNRAAVLWEPLLAVADAAGGRWPEAARDACEELIATEGLPGDDLDDLGDMLAGWE